MAERVVIVPYDPEWPILFSKLGIAFRKALSSTALRIDHIGSTAVPGLDSKPIIDIQISVPELEPVDLYRTPIEVLGFIYRADNTDLTKRYFREGAGKRRTHIHVRRAGSWSEQFALLFRDYLRANKEEANKYAEVKYRLAEKYGEDREGYTEAKGEIIWEIMQRADNWSKRVGWQPLQSDV
jgi:GrpB-like predicted nucleotidyltransferase (UPF0157 family)